MDRKNVEKSNTVRFKPLTDGLGFHPFADGLPYAPQSTPSTGTGAVSAGKPHFVYPSPAVSAAARTASHVAIPVSVSTPPTLNPLSPKFGSSIDETVDRIRRELETIQSTRMSEARAHTEQVRFLQSGKSVPHSLGYSFSRAFAFILDSAFNLSICASILSTALIATDVDHLQSTSTTGLLIVGFFLFLCNWALLAAQEVAFGTTIGKRIFGLRLYGNGLECFLRSLFFIPSLLFLGIGIFISVFDSRKRCWHDRMTQLQPEN